MLLDESLRSDLHAFYNVRTLLCCLWVGPLCGGIMMYQFYKSIWGNKGVERRQS